jgi:hypothetical protein
MSYTGAAGEGESSGEEDEVEFDQEELMEITK